MQLPVAMEAATNKGKASALGSRPRASSRVSSLQADPTLQPPPRSARTPSPDGEPDAIFPSVPTGLSFEKNQMHHRLFEGIMDGTGFTACKFDQEFDLESA